MAFEVPSLPAAAPLNPWLSIWIRPRATMRYILNTDPKAYVFGLCFIGTLLESLDRAAGRAIGDNIPFPFVLMLCAVFSLFGTLIGLEIGGRILRWVGGLLGGQGTLEGMKAALGWSSVPSLVGLLIWLPQLVVLGPDLFTTDMPRIDANPMLAMLVLATSGFEILLSAWAFVIYIKCLAEAHQFSSWRALGITLLIALPFVFIAACLIIGIGVLTLLGGRVA
ncbi:MAG: YIP1 family protein, partial [Chloroflexi bacterium]|nr:YIP1 family protein [Chloroflexota bacterium]